jgi:hypothetical protein
VSFDAAEKGGSAVEIDAAYVDQHLGTLAKDEDLSRYILCFAGENSQATDPRDDAHRRRLGLVEAGALSTGGWRCSWARWVSVIGLFTWMTVKRIRAERAPP